MTETRAGSRRALLGLAAAMAGVGALGRRSEAADGNTLKLGAANNANNTATTTTKLTGNFAGRTFAVRNTGATGARQAIHAYVGTGNGDATPVASVAVYGAIEGFMGSAAVQGTNTAKASTGVWGSASGEDGIGVLAQASGKNTVGLRASVAATSKAAVQAVAPGIAAVAVDAQASGPGGVALKATAEEGAALQATSANGLALLVEGESLLKGKLLLDESLTCGSGGAFAGGVSAAAFAGPGAGITTLNATNLATGTVSPARLPSSVAFTSAKQVRFSGKLRARSFGGPGATSPAFNSAGSVFVAKGQSRARVTTPLASRPSKVLAVLQGDPGPDVALRFVRRGKGFFEVVLSAPAVQRTRVDWFVVRRG